MRVNFPVQFQVADFSRPELSLEERKEAALLREVGLDISEIKYLMHLRVKQRLSEKWKDKD